MDTITSLGIAFQHGGIWMWAILLVQLFSIAIIVERAVVLFGKKRIGQGPIAASFEGNIRKGDLDTVIREAKAQETSAPIARAALAGATAAKFMGGKDEIQAKMDEVLVEENASFDKRTGFLAMLGNVATLTGLLGTITGMIKSFAAVSYANPAEKASLLAAGISEAMNATAYGLVTAIPALVAYAIFANRANNLAEDLNQAALKVFNWLSYAYEPVGFKNFRGDTKKSPELNA